mmetsp:Transcript_46314/g.83538  ORF Transcript_46314/g.83538 Transcript_46314/m.83538 type:complete len:395 (-) Transcript_46314:133-1317(-)|eukprot:CAMPEP_0197658008 /NCGR_PEP_ID=MMETSP1338-20131121/44977_1 /TAXON_ID=43686 ORGANISM="Pelagodinium beii, Strain RCC1491" /NCGR_SAMPLE_ID=MMETSP1338 /ASSEMBLY_ACC=CAM_ASM_000754 /LENGTH=394 /DNA_ID=CAMNT_0043234503 /DNA_START=33 /DNA_END=1217 /DNA_ORIENTATION=+
MGSGCTRSRSAAYSPLPVVPDNRDVEIPSPDKLIEDFETLDLAKQPYAELMLQKGREPKSSAEKAFRSRYTADLLRDAAADAKPFLLEGNAEALRILNSMPHLTETIIYDAEKWNSEVVPKYQAAFDALAGAPETPEVEQLRGMISKVKDLFYGEVQNPKQDFYMCLLDDMRNKYSGDVEMAKVSQESLRMMHAMDMAVHQERSNKRRDITASFYARLYESGIAGQGEWDLDAALAEHGSKAEQKSLHSETPLLSFELDSAGSERTYVLMEGNGRLTALNAALDIVRAKHPDFVAPLITVKLLPFQGPPLARENIGFLLDLTWRCTFPDLDVPGWKPQVVKSARPVLTDAEIENVRMYPRYYGYTPVQESLKMVPVTVQAGPAAMTKAVIVAGG